MNDMVEVWKVIIIAVATFVFGVTMPLPRPRVKVSPEPDKEPEPLIYGQHHFIQHEADTDGQSWIVQPYVLNEEGFYVATKEQALELMAKADAYLMPPIMQVPRSTVEP